MLKKLEKYNTDKFWENSYLTIYGIILAHHFLQTTMFVIPWPPKIGLVFYFVIMVYTIAKFLFHNKMNKLELSFAGLILAIFITSAVVSDYSFLFELGFLIVGAKDVSIDKILRVSCVVGSVILAAAFIASQSGLIENLVYESERGNRNSFGIVYPTDFAAHLFYLSGAWICINNKKLKWWHIISLIFMGVFVFKACAVYTSTLCFIILVIFAIIVDKLFDKNGKRNIILRVSTSSCAILAIGFCVMAALYSESNNILTKINTILSCRLELSHVGLEEYGYRLFGQYIPEIGNGGTIVYNWDYFFLDDSYLRIGLEYGVVTLLLVIAIWIVISNRAISETRKIMLVVLVTISIHCFMEHHLLEIAYNPFVLALFADMKAGYNYVQKDK